MWISVGPPERHPGGAAQRLLPMHACRKSQPPPVARKRGCQLCAGLHSILDQGQDVVVPLVAQHIAQVAPDAARHAVTHRLKPPFMGELTVQDICCWY